jgi:hypothetical protein
MQVQVQLLLQSRLSRERQSQACQTHCFQQQQQQQQHQQQQQQHQQQQQQLLLLQLSPHQLHWCKEVM